MKDALKPHGYITKAFHWLTALLVIYGYSKGLEDVSQLADSDFFWYEVYFASFLGLAFLARFVWTKYFGGSTRLPNTAPKWEHIASKAVHIGIYVSIFMIVITGLAIAYAYTVPMLNGTFMMVMIFLHDVAVAVTPVLVIAHIAGALWHKFIRRDGVMETMTGSFGK